MSTPTKNDDKNTIAIQQSANDCSTSNANDTGNATKSEEEEEDIYYMRQALKVAEQALAVGEVPVGCVIVLPAGVHSENQDSSVIVSHGANQVNATRDASRHAEVVAIDRLVTGGVSSDQLRLPPSIMAQSASSPQQQQAFHNQHLDTWINVPEDPSHWKNTFGWQSGRILPVSILAQCHLYVTCEPCIMCSAALATVGIGRVIFGCRNDRFGGCGSILSLHTNSDTTIPEHTPYPIVEGVLKEEAIHLLRSFYDRENFHAPDDKRKRKPNNNTTAIT